jgi:hypothetical protein
MSRADLPAKREPDDASTIGAARHDLDDLSSILVE